MAPKRKAAPRVQVSRVDLGKKILADLDAKNPDFRHSYQHPDAVTGNKKLEWEMEVKGQEVVKDENGRIIHYKGDPVVKVKRADWAAERQAENDMSREQVEAVVKPDKSTVFSSPKQVKGIEEG